MRVVMFGGTELTLALAQIVGARAVGVITVPETYRISFEPLGLKNQRYADIAGWAASRDVPQHEWSGVEAAAAFIEELRPDWGLAAGWYYMLSARILDLFPQGVAAVHASLLPKLRGNSPLNWALLLGLQRTGVSLFRMTPGLDDGPLYGQQPFDVPDRASIRDLIAAAQEIAAELVREALVQFDSGRMAMREQVGEPSYCLARVPSDSRIDWTSSTLEIDRLVRASGRPYAGAFSTFEGKRVTFWAGEFFDGSVIGTPGQLWRVPDGRMAVISGDGAFVVTECTIDGADAMDQLRRASQRRFD